MDWGLCFHSRQTMIVLLLLIFRFCEGLSSYNEEGYGNTHWMELHSKAQSIEFKSMHNSNVMILWKRDEPTARKDSRRKVMGSYFVIKNLTQEDSGGYIMRDKDQKALSTTTITVRENLRSYVRNTGERLDITFDLEPNSCNIYFFPEMEYESEIRIVRHGRMQESLSDLDCVGFVLLKPCGILNEDLQMSCSGSFEVRDSNNNRALVLKLEMESLVFHEFQTGIGIAVFFTVISCVSCCCCGKRSSKKDSSETPDAEPAVNYREYDHEPVGPRPEQLSPPSNTPTCPLIHNPHGRNEPPAYSEYNHEPVGPRPEQLSPPSNTPTCPLIHNPHGRNEPPAYSEYNHEPVGPRPEQLSPPSNTPTCPLVSAPAEQADAPSVPVYSEPGPQFEVKGMNFASAPPLTSDSPYSNVYTSDKLNFL